MDHHDCDAHGLKLESPFSRNVVLEMSQMNIVNIAAYKFVTLEDLEDRRRELMACCERNQLKGTILLSPEGINMFLAGSREGIDELLNLVQSEEQHDHNEQS